VLSLYATVSQLRAEVVELQESVRELKAKLNKDSSNSSRPPSSDHPWKKQTKKKPSSGNAPGGQPGHRAHCRALLPLEQVDIVIEYVAEQCEGCGGLLSSNDAFGESQRHQIADLPAIKPTVTEHRACDCRCTRCGTITKRSIPEKETKSAFGPNVHALVGILASRFHLSRAGLQECMEEIFGLSICVGTIQHMLEGVGRALEAPYHEALQALRQAPVRYFDETTWYIRNQRGYLWVGVCKLATVFTIAATRGQVVLRHWIGVNALAEGCIVQTDTAHTVWFRWNGEEFAMLTFAVICKAWRMKADTSASSVALR
jgi:transposase